MFKYIWHTFHFWQASTSHWSTPCSPSVVWPTCATAPSLHYPTTALVTSTRWVVSTTLVEFDANGDGGVECGVGQAQIHTLYLFTFAFFSFPVALIFGVWWCMLCAFRSGKVSRMEFFRYSRARFHTNCRGCNSAEIEMSFCDTCHTSHLIHWESSMYWSLPLCALCVLCVGAIGSKYVSVVSLEYVHGACVQGLLMCSGLSTACPCFLPINNTFAW